MVKSADDKFYPEILNKNRDLKITIMETYKAVSKMKWGFFPSALQVPWMMQCGQPWNIKWLYYHNVDNTTNTRVRDYVCLLCNASNPNQKIREKVLGGQQQHVCVAE